MKEIENKKSAWAIVLSVVALLMSVGIVILWLCQVCRFSVVSLDSFVGVIVALLAVIVTLAVGWQIYNVIEIRQMIRKIEGQQALLDESQRKLDKKQDEQNRHASLVQHLLIAEIRERDRKYAEAIYYYLGALYNAIDVQEQPNNIDLIFKRIPDCLDKLEGMTEIPAEMYNDIENIDAAIRATKYFRMFQTQYDKWLQEYMSKIVKK